MDAELREYFDQLEEMFGTDGWKKLAEDALAECETLKDRMVLEVGTLEDLWFTKGQYDILARIISMREVTEFQRRQHEDTDYADL